MCKKLKRRGRARFLAKGWYCGRVLQRRLVNFDPGKYAEDAEEAKKSEVGVLEQTHE